MVNVDAHYDAPIFEVFYEYPLANLPTGVRAAARFISHGSLVPGRDDSPAMETVLFIRWLAASARAFGISLWSIDEQILWLRDALSDIYLNLMTILLVKKIAIGSRDPKAPVLVEYVGHHLQGIDDDPTIL